MGHGFRMRMCSQFVTIARICFYQARHGVMQCITPELQEIYQLLEVEFIPLQLSSRLKVLLDELEESKELNQYVESLKEVMLVRLIKQVCSDGEREGRERAKGKGRERGRRQTFLLGLKGWMVPVAEMIVL